MSVKTRLSNPGDVPDEMQHVDLETLCRTGRYVGWIGKSDTMTERMQFQRRGRFGKNTTFTLEDGPDETKPVDLHIPRETGRFLSWV